MKIYFNVFGSGLLFSLGLALSGMTQPTKVVGFLDVFGHWDPTLLFVMASAVVVTFISYRTWQTVPHQPVVKSQITPSLILGSALFGAGWGLAGYCPGPGLVSLASFQVSPILFVSGMTLGMLGFWLLDRQIQFRR